MKTETKLILVAGAAVLLMAMRKRRPIVSDMQHQSAVVDGKPVDRMDFDGREAAIMQLYTEQMDAARYWERRGDRAQADAARTRAAAFMEQRRELYRSVRP